MISHNKILIKDSKKILADCVALVQKNFLFLEGRFRVIFLMLTLQCNMETNARNRMDIAETVMSLSAARKKFLINTRVIAEFVKMLLRNTLTVMSIIK